MASTRSPWNGSEASLDGFSAAAFAGQQPPAAAPQALNHFTVRTMQEVVSELRRCQAENRLVVLKAGATWCGPCKVIANPFHAMMEFWSQYVPLCHLDFDIDKAPAVAEHFQVEQIPFFICLLPSEHPGISTEELRFVGANQPRLEAWLGNLMHKWTNRASWGTSAIAGPPAGPPPPPPSAPSRNVI